MELPEGDPARSAETAAALRATAAGDASARAKLAEMTFGELQDLARRYLAGERQDHTLQPTALVNEAWLRLARHSPSVWNDRPHFFATCARTMRRVLVDHAKARHREKRRGERLQVSLVAAAADAAAAARGIDVIEISDAIDTLRQLSERQATIVELRFFAGMTMDEIAEATGRSARSVAEDWRFARAWLTTALAAD